MSKRKTKIPPRVEVHWYDASFGISAHWSDGSKPDRPKASEHVCLTSGYLAHADENFVCVVQTITQGQHANVANIPRGMVRSIKVLEVAGELEF